MNVLLTGASGFIGRSLIPLLVSHGHRVTRLVRTTADPARGEFYWNPSDGKLDAVALEQVDAVIHLAGENIAAGRWTKTKKRKILESRRIGTRLLAEQLAAAPHRPKVLITASAIGCYGDRGDEVLTEQSSRGTDFLANVCRDWEEATLPATEKGMRVVHARFGIILSRNGGALPRLLLPFRLGAGGTLGSGRQYMSWIALDDVTGALLHLLTSESVSGPVNIVSPSPLTNREFTKTLAKVLSRPALIPAPAFALRLLLGEMADALLLSSARVLPEQLLASGYRFQHEQLEPALRDILKK